VQADVHKDALVESVVVLYLRICDFGATAVSRTESQK
jgi:hypothetical protein